ncbi:hypothetical protein M0R45_021684 [Rubus argutus]|uniref:Uncharacterized protein n=1 Tax=Rubus argutus TaxID=59490 RepID=A0AAW1XEK2_RUBAR
MALNTVLQILEEEVVKMIKSISDESTSSSSSVDLTEKLFALMGSMTFTIVFGTSFEGSDFEHEKFHQLIVLLKIVREQTGFGAAQLGHNNIKAVLLNLFLGGIDTGAITIKLLSNLVPVKFSC